MASAQSHVRVERGGGGAGRFLLLHGLGASGGVWHDVCELITQAGIGEWLRPDLPGHGGSGWRSSYSVGEMAAALTPFLDGPAPTLVIGHSLGVYIGLALASEWFGVRVAGVVGIGPKISWTERELQSMRELSLRPVRAFATRTEALERYRKVSGLDQGIAERPEFLARGVTRIDDEYRLAQDPLTFSVAGAPFATLVSSARCPVLLARGERDAMVSLAELREHCADAVDIAGCGHNAHVENAAQILRLVERLSLRQ